jgi:predicted nucleotide-binding protein
MIQKSKTYSASRFPVSTINEACQNFLLKEKSSDEKPYIRGTIGYGDEEWIFDSLEEFLAEYANAVTFFLRIAMQNQKMVLDIQCSIPGGVIVRISADDRKDIESIFIIFERDLEKSKIIINKVEADPIKIFIGHGGDNQWRVLKDHLQDEHNFKVEAYEIGPRAGSSVKEVLQEMLNKSSIAFLVLTGEDVKNYGELHARQNVVHELGLFQGKLGFKRAIALLEEGTTEFSNINGVNQIRFLKGNIRETFGDVVAIINREFPRN